MPVARGVKMGIIGTVTVVMFSVAGYGAYNVYTSLDGGGDDSANTTHSAADIEANANKPVTVDDAAKTASDFLKAWSAGDTAKAAGLTTATQTATGDLEAFTARSAITGIAATPEASTTATVPFTVKATITFQKLPAKVWTYKSSLTVGRNESGQPAVKWAPNVLEPDLKDADQIVTALASSPQVDLVDRNDVVMTVDQYPGLTPVFADLRKRYAGKDLGGTPGVETRIVDGNDNSEKTLFVVKPGKNAQLRTTLDAKIQAAAEKAVKKATQSGVTAVDTRNGKILAMASNPPDGQNYALTPRAPGSTFKIITATAILLDGKTPSSRSQCYDNYNLPGGRHYHNVTPDNGSATLSWDFENSCNTGFIRLEPELPTNFLPNTARKYFGLGSDEDPWWVGTGVSDATVPGGTGDELSSEMIGQGLVQMTTLHMASVAATVVSGKFHQPAILQDTGMIQQRADISTTRLPSSVRRDLMLMMQRTADRGTARGLLHGVAWPYGAKTGSAEESQEGAPDGWFTAYAGHVAAAGVVISGGHGNASAGPIVGDVLRAAS